MKIFKFFLFTAILALVMACSSDDDSSDNANSQYPITLSYSGIGDNDFKFFQNGKQSELPDAIKNDNIEYDRLRNTLELEADVKNDYYKFLSDSQVEISESGEMFTMNYEFKDGYFYVIYEGKKLLYGQGDYKKIEYRLSALVVKKENSTSSSSGSYEDEEDINYFPTTFTNSKDGHGYSKIEDVGPEEYVLIHNVSLVYK